MPVPPEPIDAALAALDDEAAVERAFVQFAAEQAPYLQYLRTDGFAILSEDERDYLQYLGLVLYEAVAGHRGRRPATLAGEALEEWDERCWTWMQDTVGRPIRQRLDAFFDGIDEEELLAFAEDSLVDADPEDEAAAELFASATSREVGLVGLGVLIGALAGQPGAG